MEIYKNRDITDMPDEIWLPITGFESLYHVSNMGRVKALGNGLTHSILMIKSQSFDSSGYLCTKLMLNGYQFVRTVHRMVAIAFIPNPENKPQVNHKFGIKIDNRATELEWNTGSENTQHSYDFGLNTGGMTGKKGKDHHSSKPVMQIGKDGSMVRSFESLAQATEKTGIGWSTISAVCKGKRKTAGGFKWKYAI